MRGVGPFSGGKWRSRLEGDRGEVEGGTKKKGERGNWLACERTKKGSGDPT